MGLVTIRQEQGATLATYHLKLSGLAVNQAHGVHVHQYGDLSDMCSGTGSMFNGNGKNFKNLLPWNTLCLVKPSEEYFDEVKGAKYSCRMSFINLNMNT